jgi:hypothetical protein
VGLKRKRRGAGVDEDSGEDEGVEGGASGGGARASVDLHRTAASRMMIPSPTHRRALLSLLRAGPSGVALGSTGPSDKDRSPLRSLYVFLQKHRPELLPFLPLQVFSAMYSCRCFI